MPLQDKQQDPYYCNKIKDQAPNAFKGQIENSPETFKTSEILDFNRNDKIKCIES